MTCIPLVLNRHARGSSPLLVVALLAASRRRSARPHIRSPIASSAPRSRPADAARSHPRRVRLRPPRRVRITGFLLLHRRHIVPSRRRAERQARWLLLPAAATLVAFHQQRQQPHPFPGCSIWTSPQASSAPCRP